MRVPTGAGKAICFGIGVAALAVFGGCNRDVAVDIPPPTVTVTQAIEKKVQDWDEYTGRLAAVGSVEIRPRVSGYLTEIKFEDGDMVKKGEVLFVIDPRPYQADYNNAKGEYDKADSSLKLANADFERDKQLRDKGAIAAAQFDKSSAAFLQAQGALLSARAALESAQLNLEFCSITAPIDGRASLANITVGNLVSPQTEKPLTTIVTIDPIYAYADVDERSLLRYIRDFASKGVTPGNEEQVKAPIELSLQDESHFNHRGYIDFVDNVVNPETGTIRMRGVFNSENGLLAPGMFVRLRIPAGEPFEAVLIPERAVGTDQGEKFVYLVGPDNAVAYQKVTLGRVHDGLQVITDGLSAGQTVIVDGLLKARPGAKVDPKPMATAEPAGAPAAAPEPSPAAQ